MKITKTSPFTGQENTMEIDVPVDQLIAWKAGGLIQNVMPQLTADEREFLMTGLTPACWDDAGLNEEPSWLLNLATPSDESN